MRPSFIADSLLAGLGVLGTGYHFGPAVDGLVQVAAILLHRIGELVTKQFADVDAVDDHVAYAPFAVVVGHGVGHRVDLALTPGHFHADAGAFRILLATGRQHTNLLVVVLQQRVAVELHEAALEVFLEAIHLLGSRVARVADRHDAARDAFGIHHRAENPVQCVIERRRVLAIPLLVGLAIGQQLIGGLLDHLMGTRRGLGKQRHASQQDQEAMTQGSHDVENPHSLCTVLSRNLPISSSSASEDWVSRITSASASTSSSPPTLMPMYFSPSNPAVRIEAVESAGRMSTLR